MTRTTKHIAAAIIATTTTLALVEVGAYVLIKTGLIVAQRPNHGTETYWWGDHPEFGVWRYPNAEFHHRASCFDVRYHANSVGMRDRERPLETADHRVVVLGDSFMEGWGINDSERLSNRLEQATGVPHMNFAMAHFGTYQEYLVYTKLASQYSHDAVILGFLPVNDFRDTDFDLSKRFEGYEYVYRPYLLGSAPPYTSYNWQEPAARKYLRRYSYAFNAILPLFGSGGGAQGTMMWTAPERDAHSGAARFSPSWFYDFTDEQINRVQYILGQLAHAASGKRVYILLIPSAVDFYRYLISGADPLEAHLKPLEQQYGVRVIDFLPLLASKPAEAYRYVLECDPHWSAYANEVAAKYLIDTIGPELYQHTGE